MTDIEKEKTLAILRDSNDVSKCLAYLVVECNYSPIIAKELMWDVLDDFYPN